MSEFKFVAFSDMHWQEEALLKVLLTRDKDESVDAIFICGDCDLYKQQMTDIQQHPEKFGRLFNEYLTKDLVVHTPRFFHVFAKLKKLYPNAKLIYVPGNHDEMKATMVTLPQVGMDEILIDRAIEIKGVKIYGTPFWETTFIENINSQCRNFYTSHMDLCVGLIPDDVDILLTHAPANMLNYESLWFSKDSPAPKFELEKWFETRPIDKCPSIHVHGHDHGEAGKIEIQVLPSGAQVLSLNVACLDNDYDLIKASKIGNVFSLRK